MFPYVVSRFMFQLYDILLNVLPFFPLVAYQYSLFLQTSDATLFHDVGLETHAYSFVLY